MSILGKSFGSKLNVPGGIFRKFLLSFVLVLMLASQALYAQQSNADTKKLSEIRAKAEKGDAEAQVEFGRILSQGKLGVTKDEVGAVKWFRKAADQNFFPLKTVLLFATSMA
jgi:TPR repeat protein